MVLLLFLLLAIGQFVGLLEGQQQLATCNVRQYPFSNHTSGQVLGATLYIDLNNPFHLLWNHHKVEAVLQE